MAVTVERYSDPLKDRGLRSYNSFSGKVSPSKATGLRRYNTAPGDYPAARVTLIFKSTVNQTASRTLSLSVFPPTLAKKSENSSNRPSRKRKTDVYESSLVDSSSKRVKEDETLESEKTKKVESPESSLEPTLEYSPPDFSLVERLEVRRREERVEKDKKVVRDKLAVELWHAKHQKESGEKDALDFELKTLKQVREEFEKQKKKDVGTISLNAFRKFFRKGGIHRGSKEVNGKQIGWFSCVGGYRLTNEDAIIVESLAFDIAQKKHAATISAVCDGHGGKKAADYCRTHLTACLKKNLLKHNPEKLTKVGVWNALKMTTKDLDDAFRKQNPGITDGTTVCCTVDIEGKKYVWVMNVGDSRVTHVSTIGKGVPLSTDAKPDDVRFVRPVRVRGGDSKRIIRNVNGRSIDYGYRVNGVKLGAKGGLSLARAVGDDHMTRWSGIDGVRPMTSRAKVTRSEVINGYLVIACDGLYDVISSKRMGELVDSLNGKVSPQKIAEMLACGAFMNGSTDNISVIVIKV